MFYAQNMGVEPSNSLTIKQKFAEPPGVSKK